MKIMSTNRIFDATTTVTQPTTPDADNNTLRVVVNKRRRLFLQNSSSNNILSEKLSEIFDPPACQPDENAPANSTLFTETRRKFVGQYEILTESGQDRPGDKCFVVKKHEKSQEIALLREISQEKFLRYKEIYRRLSEKSHETADEARLCGYDENEVFERLWPSSMQIFAEKDENGSPKHYCLSPRHYGTLHNHVIAKKRLDEQETKMLFRQIVETLAYCHARGVVVRDVKLRKFVFCDDVASHHSLVRRLRLADLDELVVLTDATDDSMRERHGCPAYVSPEILDLSAQFYAGKSADVWGLGVLLYVLLMGRYPFYDTTPGGLFGKIRAANFHIAAEQTSYEARVLIRCLLRKNPRERPTVARMLRLNWLRRDWAASRQLFFNSAAASETQQKSQQRKRGAAAADDAAAGCDDDDDQRVPALEPKIVRVSTATSDVTEQQRKENAQSMMPYVV